MNFALTAHTELRGFSLARGEPAWAFPPKLRRAGFGSRASFPEVSG